jgi:hypothetical protein
MFPWILGLPVSSDVDVQHYQLVDEREMAPLQELVDTYTGGVMP